MPNFEIKFGFKWRHRSGSSTVHRESVKNVTSSKSTSTVWRGKIYVEERQVSCQRRGKRLGLSTIPKYSILGSHNYISGLFEWSWMLSREQSLNMNGEDRRTDVFVVMQEKEFPTMWLKKMIEEFSDGLQMIVLRSRVKKSVSFHSHNFRVGRWSICWFPSNLHLMH